MFSFDFQVKIRGYRRLVQYVFPELDMASKMFCPSQNFASQFLCLLTRLHAIPVRNSCDEIDLVNRGKNLWSELSVVHIKTFLIFVCFFIKFSNMMQWLNVLEKCSLLPGKM